MSHLTPDQLIGAVDEAPSGGAQAHLATCASCRERVDELSFALKATKSAEVPEPSPFFWQHFSNRVRSAVDAETTAPRRWLRWPVLAPLAGLVVLVSALAITMPRATRTVPVEISDTQTGDLLIDDVGWTLVIDAVGTLDWETATEVGLTIEPGAVDRVVLELTADEQRALGALLQAELRAKS